MKILTATSCQAGDPYHLEEAVIEASRSISVEATQEFCHIDELDDTSSFHGVIFHVKTAEEFFKYRRIIQKRTVRFPRPYLLFIERDIPSDVNHMGHLLPDQLILLPISQAQLLLTIRLFFLKIQHGYHIYGLEERDKKKVWLSVKRGVYKGLEADKIKWVEASDHYVKVFTDAKDFIMIKTSLKDFYEKHLIQFDDFYFLNRSLIINVSKVSKIENGKLYIDQDKPLSIPRTKREAVMDALDVG